MPFRDSQYYDTTFNATYGTSVTSYNITAGLISNLFPSGGPANFRVFGASIGGIGSRYRLFVKSIELIGTYTGSESNALAVGDFTNIMRLIIVDAYVSSNQTPPAVITKVDDEPNSLMNRLLYNEIVTLPSQAFNSADYNVPNQKQVTMRRPVYRTYPVFAESGAIIAVSPNIVVNICSDSAIAPNPTFRGTLRVYFHLVVY